MPQDEGGGGALPALPELRSAADRLEANVEYEPTEEEIREYAGWLGMDPDHDKDMLWIARKGLKTPLPEPWRPCESGDGEIFYFNPDSGESKWDHPCDDELREIYAKERAKKAKELQERERLNRRAEQGSGSLSGSLEEASESLEEEQEEQEEEEQGSESLEILEAPVQDTGRSRGKDPPGLAIAAPLALLAPALPPLGPPRPEAFLSGPAPPTAGEAFLSCPAPPTVGIGPPLSKPASPTQALGAAKGAAKGPAKGPAKGEDDLELDDLLEMPLDLQASGSFGASASASAAAKNGSDNPAKDADGAGAAQPAAEGAPGATEDSARRDTKSKPTLTPLLDVLGSPSDEGSAQEESPSLSPSPSPVLGEDGPCRGLKAWRPPRMENLGSLSDEEEFLGSGSDGFRPVGPLTDAMGMLGLNSPSPPTPQLTSILAAELAPESPSLVNVEEEQQEESPSREQLSLWSQLGDCPKEEEQTASAGQFRAAKKATPSDSLELSSLSAVLDHLDQSRVGDGGGSPSRSLKEDLGAAGTPEAAEAVALPSPSLARQAATPEAEVERAARALLEAAEAVALPSPSLEADAPLYAPLSPEPLAEPRLADLARENHRRSAAEPAAAEASALGLGRVAGQPGAAAEPPQAPQHVAAAPPTPVAAEQLQSELRALAARVNAVEVVRVAPCEKSPVGTAETSAPRRAPPEQRPGGGRDSQERPLRLELELQQLRAEAADGAQLLQEARLALSREQAARSSAEAMAREARAEAVRLQSRLKHRDAEVERIAAELQRSHLELIERNGESHGLRLQLHDRDAELAQLRLERTALSRQCDVQQQHQRLKLQEKEQMLEDRERFLDDREQLAAEAELRLCKQQREVRVDMQRAELGCLRATLQEMTLPCSRGAVTLVASPQCSGPLSVEEGRGRKVDIALADTRGSVAWPWPTSSDSLALVGSRSSAQLEGSHARASSSGSSTVSLREARDCAGDAAEDWKATLRQGGQKPLGAPPLSGRSLREVTEALRARRRELRTEHAELEEDRRQWRGEANRLRRSGRSASPTKRKGLSRSRAALDQRAATLNRSIGEYRALERFIASSQAQAGPQPPPSGEERASVLIQRARRRAHKDERLALKGAGQSGEDSAPAAKPRSEDKKLLQRWQHALGNPQKQGVVKRSARGEGGQAALRVATAGGA